MVSLFPQKEYPSTSETLNIETKLKGKPVYNGLPINSPAAFF